MNLQDQLIKARQASHAQMLATAEQKNKALQKIADFLREHTDRILEENKKDMAEGEQNNLGSILDRLLLTPERIEAMAKDIETVISLEDPIGKTLYEYQPANGLQIKKVTVPIGVIGMIYESRPNVTVDAAVLALKSGNAIVLKGGKEAAYSNRVLAEIMREALSAADAEPETIQLLDGATREDTAALIKAKGKIDILIPRGSNSLIRFVSENATVPVIETGASPVHTFVDASANIKMAVDICVNEKVRRVSVCNALDTILVHTNIAKEFLPQLATALQESANTKKHPPVQIHTDQESHNLLQQTEYPHLSAVIEHDYDTEWLDYALSIHIVPDLDEAIAHIRTHSLGHSESIITEDKENAARFLSEIDAACVYHNASTCFSDGAQFGLGAEIGISTQKLHARGPFALEGLTSTKWIVKGSGQTRD